MPQLVDLTLKRFGRWVVLERAPGEIRLGAHWLCRCDCGNEKVIRGQSLRKGDSRSCGCLNRDQKRQICVDRNTSHGQSKTRTYRIWTGLFSRRTPAYANVDVCTRWGSFENFLEDMGQPPTKYHSIDRVDNNKGYEPGNCRWATQKEQQNNRTNNRNITYKGKTQTLQQWSEETGINQGTLWTRIVDLKWPLERALTQQPSHQIRSDNINPPTPLLS